MIRVKDREGVALSGEEMKQSCIIAEATVQLIYEVMGKTHPLLVLNAFRVALQEVMLDIEPGIHREATWEWMSQAFTREGMAEAESNLEGRPK